MPWARERPCTAKPRRSGAASQRHPSASEKNRAARAASATHSDAYPTSPWRRRAGPAAEGSGRFPAVRLDTVTPWGRSKARNRRARRRAANPGSGSATVWGRRRASKGSAIGVLLVVGAPEGRLGPDQQGLGAVQRPAQLGGHLQD